MTESFSSGQEELLRGFSRSIEENRMPHAVILEGPGGCGKTALALRFAQAAVCAGEGERPCGSCAGCIKAAAGSHPDISVEGGGTAARSFHVDAVRRIRAEAYIRPNEAPRRVFLLLDAQTMSEQAQNALLKVLEEPPPGVLFLLTVPAANALLPTVRSRAQILSLEGGGTPQDGDRETAAAIAAALPVSDEALLEAFAPLVRDRDGLRRVLSQLSLLLRDASVFRAGADSCLSGQPEAARALGMSIPRDRLLFLLEETGRARAAQERNANTALLVTALCARLRGADSDLD